jgi:hypothetical protein
MIIVVFLAINGCVLQWRLVARVLAMEWRIFRWLLRGAISHPSSQSTFVVIASCNTMYQDQGTLVAFFFAASWGLPLSRLIVARAIPIASQAFATVAIWRSVGGAAVVATAIVVNTTTTIAPISAVDEVVALIVAKSNLAAFFFA